jgi:pyruvate dehydrogenase E1 component beta subunit
MAELSYRNAVHLALAQEMERDERVVLIGEDLRQGGVFKPSKGLFEQFGPDRVWDTPIAEQAILGCAMGAAMTGIRPVAEIMFAAQHSQSVENWAMCVPGLKIASPSDPADLKGLLSAAIRDDDPVLFFEHKALYASKGEAREGEHVVRLGQAAVRREGHEVALVGLGQTVHLALEAADRLAQSGVEATVIDLRTLVPLDARTVLDAVRRTGRVVIVEENPIALGWGAGVAALVAEEGFQDLKAAVRRVCGLNVPIPFAANLEAAALPSSERVVEAVEAVLA